MNDAPTDLAFIGNSGLSAGTSGGNTTISNNSTLFTLSTIDPDNSSGFTYKFGGSGSVGVTVGGNGETFSMGSSSGGVTTTNLSYNTVQTIALTTPTTTDGGGSKSP